VSLSGWGGDGTIRGVRHPMMTLPQATQLYSLGGSLAVCLRLNQTDWDGSWGICHWICPFLCLNRLPLHEHYQSPKSFTIGQSCIHPAEITQLAKWLNLYWKTLSECFYWRNVCYLCLVISFSIQPVPPRLHQKGQSRLLAHIEEGRIWDRKVCCGWVAVTLKTN